MQLSQAYEAFCCAADLTLLPLLLHSPLGICCSAAVPPQIRSPLHPYMLFSKTLADRHYRFRGVLAQALCSFNCTSSKMGRHAKFVKW